MIKKLLHKLREVLGITPSAAAAALLALSLVFPAMRAEAQAPSVTGPYNIDLGAIVTTLVTAGTDATNTTVTISAAQTNLNVGGVECTINTSAMSGSPSISFDIQEFDSASNSWLTLAASGQDLGRTVNNPAKVEVYPGIQTTSLPTGFSAAVSLHLPRVWRARVAVSKGTAAGSVAAATTLGCNYLQ